MPRIYVEVEDVVLFDGTVDQPELEGISKISPGHQVLGGVAHGPRVVVDFLPLAAGVGEERPQELAGLLEAIPLGTLHNPPLELVTLNHPIVHVLRAVVDDHDGTVRYRFRVPGIVLAMWHTRTTSAGIEEPLGPLHRGLIMEDEKIVAEAILVVIRVLLDGQIKRESDIQVRCSKLRRANIGADAVRANISRLRVPPRRTTLLHNDGTIQAPGV
mmetsp:Transcript_150129/g.262225  ORF Transcript_150129/g.262225 Transcript_150129/m.262225 type:complete len:215 (+) Transcript_150129:3160-3804(+)